MFVYYNPNPEGHRVDDCSIRALTKALNVDWDTAFALVSAEAFKQKNMPSANVVWGAVLYRHGFIRQMAGDACPICYTVADFCREYPTGTYVLSCDGHVVTVADGRAFDSWNSLGEHPLFFWRRSDDK